MPVYNTVLLDIDAKETRRYAGLNKAKDFDEKLIEEACLEARLLAEPRGIWQMYDYDADAQTVLADPPFTMRGKLIGKHLAKAQKVIILSASVRLAQSEKIGVHLSDASMLVPRKSITAVIGLVPQQTEKEMHTPNGCAACDKFDCPSRKTTETG